MPSKADIKAAQEGRKVQVTNGRYTIAVSETRAAILRARGWRDAGPKRTSKAAAEKE